VNTDPELRAENERLKNDLFRAWAVLLDYDGWYNPRNGTGNCCEMAALIDEAVSILNGNGTRANELADLRVRVETLEYHLNRKTRDCRELEQEVQELRAALGIRGGVRRHSDYDYPSGWGKGKDE
jgi:hypothetical protein